MKLRKIATRVQIVIKREASWNGSIKSKTAPPSSSFDNTSENDMLLHIKQEQDSKDEALTKLKLKQANPPTLVSKTKNTCIIKQEDMTKKNNLGMSPFPHTDKTIDMFGNKTS